MKFGRATVVAVVVGTALSGLSALSACSVSTDAGAPEKGSGSDLPASIADTGVIDVATFYNYPPYTLVEDGELKGIEVDMIRAVADRLGVKAEFHDLKFEAMIPSIVNGRNDVMIGGLADLPERHSEVHFLDYYNARLRFLVKKGNPAGVRPDDVCGKVFVVATASTHQMDLADKASTACTDAGSSAIKTLQVDDPGDVYLALINGRGDFTFQDPAKAKHVVEGEPRLEMLDGFLPGDDGTASGWIFAQDNDELRGAFADAIGDLVEDGTWQKILDKAGLADVALIPVQASPPLAG